MISLFKNHQHFSSTFFMEQFNCDDKSIYFTKSSSSIEGVRSIYRELKGIDWYNSKTNNLIKYKVSIKRNNYIKVKFNKIEGSIPKFSKQTYSSNIQKIEIIIDHYCTVWGSCKKNSKLPIHGDLSLIGNIIFTNENKPVIIDWEHFNNNASPIGYDAIYFLFELLWFQIYHTNKMCNFSINHIRKMLLTLRFNNCLDTFFVQKPLKTTIDFILDNNKYWGPQIEKLTIIKFKKNQIELIDKILNDLNA